MTQPSRALGTTGWVMLALGLLGLLGAAGLVLGPGFRTAPPVPFGQVLTVELPAGEHAVYVTPSDRWSSITCTGEVGGREVALRSDMTLQGLLLPERWDAQGSIGTDTVGTLEMSCDGPVEDGRFTVGPAVAAPTLVGSVLLTAVALVAVGVGAALVLIGRRRRSRAQPPSGRTSW